MTTSARTIEPYKHGMLEVGDGHSIYWECFGNPNGVPVFYLHGGPGSGCGAGARRFFNPEEQNAVLFDQRGCGRSQPLLNTLSQLRNNTTQHLVRDIEALRAYLRIERLAVLGLSWGTTLALAYAQAFPERIRALVLGCVTTTTRREVDWITRDVGCLFPEQWHRFTAHIPSRFRGERIVDAYAQLLFDDDPEVCATAAREWCAWEDAHVSLSPGHVRNPRFEGDEFRLRFARLVTHYWRHSAFLGDEQLARGMGVLAEVPGVLIHGKYDVSSPLETAWALHNKWPRSELLVVDEGHGGASLAREITASLQRVLTT